jgi:Holliday junction resolvase RusA-like endonuclease
MLLLNGEPEYRLWIPGTPKSRQSTTFQRYRDSIQRVARQQFPAPLNGNVEVEVVFADKGSPCPDTDNVLKPIMDALKGIAYRDDSQVVSAKAHLLPPDDALRTVNGQPHNTFVRLLDTDQFLIRVKERPVTAFHREVRST